MTASRAARERRAQGQAGELAKVSVEVGPDDGLVYKIRCRRCEGRPGVPWATYRKGAENDFLAAMDRWTIHLSQKHLDATADCLEFLDQAVARLHERNPRS
ncbi:MAG: hypothetical protein NTV23_02155 [Propionibacteriales bacterium]|nr:hypothetical protein [Propionibacteriales bacterium]